MRRMDAACMCCVVFFMAVALASTMSGVAYGQTIEIVTGRGNVFVMGDDGRHLPGTTPNSTASASANGTSVIEGLGLNSRMIHKEYAGTITHGTGLLGTEESVKPYTDIPGETRFAISMLDGDTVLESTIPDFYSRYRYDDDTLVKTADELPNILGYATQRRISGDVTVSVDDGIKVSGAGRMILELTNYTGSTLIVTGNLSDGTTIRPVQSPYDLITTQYDPARGFLINHCACNPTTRSLSLLVGSVDDSEKSAVFEYDRHARAAWYHGKCCQNRYTTTGHDHRVVEATPVLLPDASGYHRIVGDSTDATFMNINDIRRPGAKLYRVYVNSVDDFDHKIYDTLPAKESHPGLSGTFERQMTFPAGTSYLVVDSAGGDSHIRGTSLQNRDFVDIAGLPPDTGYRLERDGFVIVSGITSGTGMIRIGSFENNAFSSLAGSLRLYPDSMTYLRDEQGGVPGLLVFDHANGQLIRMTHQDDTVYNVHAYVKIPIVRAVHIGNVSLAGDVPLDYIGGQYAQGDDLLIPIIPTHRTVSLWINGVHASLDIADVLGGTGLRIADSVTGTMNRSTPDDFVRSIEAVVGVVTYMVANSDGNARAHVQASVYGDSEITNTRTYTTPPPPPPPPRPRDPLTTWIQVYVNGQLQPIDGRTETQIFFSDTPEQNHTGASTQTSSYNIVRFNYPPVRVFDTVSVPVASGDFVEFYFYNKIYAEGSVPPIPAGSLELTRQGTASASVTIEHASINTGM